MLSIFRRRDAAIEQLEPRRLLAGDVAGDFAEVAQMAVDTNQEVGRSRTLSSVEADGKIYFFATDGGGDLGLWSSDGSEAGTQQIAKIPANYRRDHSLCCDMQLAGNRLFFVVDSIHKGYAANPTESIKGDTQLWGADFTTRGTRLVTTLGEWSTERRIFTYMVDNDGDLLMSVSDGCCGTRLWTSDGTTAGTAPYSPEFDTGHRWDGYRVPVRLADSWYSLGTVEGVPGSYYGLWQTDPVAGTLQLLEAIPASRGRRTPSRLIAGEDRLYFVADSGEGDQLWISNGTAAGTRPFGEVHPHYTERPRPLVVLDNRLLYTITNRSGVAQIWQTDGTEAGTELLGEVAYPELRASVAATARFGDALYLGVSGTLSPHDKNRYELWRLRNGQVEYVRSFERRLDDFQIHDGKLVFRATGAAGDDSLWRSDGTAEGTVSLGPNLTPIGTANGSLILSHQQQLYSVDSNDQLIPLYELPLARLGSEPYAIATTTSGVFFLSEWDGLLRHWDTDATEPEIVQNLDFKRSFVELFPTVYTGHLVAFEDALYGFGGSGLWKAEAGADAIKLLRYGATRAEDIVATVDNGDRLYFARRRLSSGTAELWGTDGTFEGTVSVSGPLTITSEQQTPRVPTLLYQNGVVVLRVGNQVWRYTESTQTIQELPAASAIEIGVLDDRLYLIRRDENSIGLWSSDGTDTGTLLIRPLTVAPHADDGAIPTAYPEMLSTADGLVFTDGRGGLWKSDGTAAGTTKLAQFDVDAGPSGLVRAGDRLVFFAADDGVHGEEIWYTDGTMEGTRLAADVLPGPDGSRPRSIAAGQAEIYFAADDGQHGRELWRIPLDVPLNGDTDRDGAVDFADFLVLSQHYGQSTTRGAEAGDLDDDGLVNFEDFLLLSQDYGRRRPVSNE